MKKIQKTLKPYIKLGKNNYKFGDIEIEKQKIHEHKRLTSIKNDKY